MVVGWGRWQGGHKNINVEAHGGILVASYEEGERPKDTRANCVSHRVLFSTKKATVPLAPQLGSKTEPRGIFSCLGLLAFNILRLEMVFYKCLRCSKFTASMEDSPPVWEALFLSVGPTDRFLMSPR